MLNVDAGYMQSLKDFPVLNKVCYYILGISYEPNADIWKLSCNIPLELR